MFDRKQKLVWLITGVVAATALVVAGSLALNRAAGTQSVDAVKLMEIVRAYGDDSEISALAISADGRLLATGNDGGLIKVWDAVSGGELFEFEQSKGDLKRSVRALAFTGDGALLASAVGDMPVQLRSVETGVPGDSLPVEEAYSLQFSPSGTYLAIGGGWELHLYRRNGELVGSVPKAHENGAIFAVDFAPDETMLASAGRDGVVRLWQVPTLTLLRTFAIDETRLQAQVPPDQRAQVHAMSVVFSGDGKRLAANTNEGTVYVWDLPTGREIARVVHSFGGEEYIAEAFPRSLLFGADGRWLLAPDRSGSGMRLLRVPGDRSFTTPIRTGDKSPYRVLAGVTRSGVIALALRRGLDSGAPAHDSVQVWRVRAR